MKHANWYIDQGAYRRTYFEAIASAPSDMPEELYRLLSTPMACALTQEFLNSPRRVLVLGQETFENDQGLAQCNAFNAWSRQIGGYIAFDYAYGGTSQQASGRFWTAFDEITAALGLENRRSLAWSNLVKVQLLDGTKTSVSISNLPAEDQMAVVRWQRNLFRAELEHVSPDGILFLTGDLHWVAKHMFDGHRLIPREGFEIVQIEGLDIPMAKTWHPNARKWRSVVDARAAAISYLRTDPPPLRWSILKYGFEPRRTCMSRKRHKPEEIVAKLRQVDVLVSQGQSVADAVRSIGVTEVTYYRWRQEFGGLKSDQVKRLKDLETENQRLRRAIADLTLDKLILQEAARGNY